LTFELENIKQTLMNLSIRDTTSEHCESSSIVGNRFDEYEEEDWDESEEEEEEEEDSDLSF
jgi:hypothetical protein